MSALLGHCLGAVAAGRMPAFEKHRRFLFSAEVTLAALFLAAAPDLDIAYKIFYQGQSSHRGPSHSLLVSAGLVLLVWLVVSRLGRRGGLVLPLALVLASLSHLMLDYLTGCGPKIMLFWPFGVEGFQCPVQLVPTGFAAGSMERLLRVMVERRSLIGMTLELMIFTPVLLAQKYASGRLLRWLPYLAVSASAVFLAYLIYQSGNPL